jgi:hypothetical protein
MRDMRVGYDAILFASSFLLLAKAVSVVKGLHHAAR